MVFFRILILSFILFGFSQIIHILLWRYKHPNSPWIPLITLFLIIPLIIELTLIYLNVKVQLFLTITEITISEWVAVYLLHFALSLSYFFLYPTAQYGSPSIRLSLFLSARMPEGGSSEELEMLFSAKDDIGPRINDLLVSGYVKYSTDGVLQLTQLGKLFILPFVLLRRIFGEKINEE
jgi:hypothetical protein